MINYRKLWEEHYGPIPVDSEGRSFHIHHVDGNRANNAIENLEALSARDHYERHLEQGDYGAAFKLAQLLKLDPETQKRLKSEHGKTLLGPKNPFFDKTHTKHTKKRIANKLKGRKPSAETTRRRILAQTGQKKPPYHKFLCPHCLYKVNKRTHVPKCSGEYFII